MIGAAEKQLAALQEEARKQAAKLASERVQYDQAYTTAAQAGNVAETTRIWDNYFKEALNSYRTLGGIPDSNANTGGTPDYGPPPPGTVVPYKPKG